MIRTATAADLTALHALVEGAYRGDSARRGWTHEADLLDGQRIDVAALADVLADPDKQILLAVAGAALAGCVQISRVGARTAYLGLLAVEPGRQARGIGGMLIAAAEAFARDHFGADRIEMTVIRQRGALIDYYARRGYVATGEERPFPMHDPRFGVPKTDLAFAVLEKTLPGARS